MKDAAEAFAGMLVFAIFCLMLGLLFEPEKTGKWMASVVNAFRMAAQ